jgi:hypothetical protein
MQAPYKSYNAKITPFPKSMNAIYIKENDFFLLFFSIRYLGFLQLVLKPRIFIKTDKELFIKDKNVKLIRDFDIVETTENRTIVFPNKDGIKKIMIPNK